MGDRTEKVNPLKNFLGKLSGKSIADTSHKGSLGGNNQVEQRKPASPRFRSSTVGRSTSNHPVKEKKRNKADIALNNHTLKATRKQEKPYVVLDEKWFKTDATNVGNLTKEQGEAELLKIDQAAKVLDEEIAQLQRQLDELEKPEVVENDRLSAKGISGTSKAGVENSVYHDNQCNRALRCGFDCTGLALTTGKLLKQIDGAAELIGIAKSKLSLSEEHIEKLAPVLLTLDSGAATKVMVYFSTLSSFLVGKDLFRHLDEVSNEAGKDGTSIVFDGTTNRNVDHGAGSLLEILSSGNNAELQSLGIEISRELRLGSLALLHLLARKDVDQAAQLLEASIWANWPEEDIKRAIDALDPKLDDLKKRSGANESTRAIFAFSSKICLLMELQTRLYDCVKLNQDVGRFAIFAAGIERSKGLGGKTYTSTSTST